LRDLTKKDSEMSRRVVLGYAKLSKALTDEGERQATE
jgi:hypothetical protein